MKSYEQLLEDEVIALSRRRWGVLAAVAVVLAALLTPAYLHVVAPRTDPWFPEQLR